MALLSYVPRGPVAESTAVASALASFFNVLPTVLGVIAGTLGIGWYCVLFYDRFIAKGVAADKEEGA